MPIITVLPKVFASEHRRAPVEAAHEQRAREDQADRDEVRGHGTEIQLLHLHLAHRAKQQRRREHEEDQVGQVLHAGDADPLAAAGEIANRDQHDDRQQCREDGVVHARACQGRIVGLV
jgi:hypothetical protein